MYDKKVFFSDFHEYKKHHLRRGGVYEKTAFLQHSPGCKPYGLGGARTPDFYLVEVALSQLSYETVLFFIDIY